jgi:predicted GIY-YIG superfamily endonuclease
MTHFFYIVRCADDSLYCGMTNNLEKRVKEHNSKGTRGARYTKTRQPVKLVHHEKFESIGDAMRREAAVKRWHKVRKEALFMKKKKVKT